MNNYLDNDSVHLTELGELCSSGQIAVKVLRFTVGTIVVAYFLRWGSSTLRNREKS